LIAEGIIKAAQIVDLKVPLVTRIAGNNSERGRQLLEEHARINPKFRVKVGKDIAEAAQIAADTAREESAKKGGKKWEKQILKECEMW